MMFSPFEHNNCDNNESKRYRLSFEQQTLRNIHLNVERHTFDSSLKKCTTATSVKVRLVFSFFRLISLKYSDS